MVYESDPERAPDTDFVPGELGLLVPGNTGRMLDARRTPVTVVAVRPEVGAFVVEVGAFEDAGARWELPLEEFGRFQFARDAVRRDAGELERALARFDRVEAVPCDPQARAATLRRVADERADARAWLRDRLPAVDVAAAIARREGAPELCAEHLVARLGFTQALLSLLGHEAVTLYRAAAVEGPLPEPRPASLVSATFSRPVAEAHFDGGTTAVLWRQATPLDRVLMTFLETAALNAPYKEAEAILVADPGNRAF